MAAPLVGARISVLSKSGLRYEGTIHSINTQEATVSVQNVKSFGTEGRRQDGPQIPPNPELFEYVIFRGCDLEEIEVCEAAKTPVACPAPDFVDPAIIVAKPAETGPGSSASVYQAAAPLAAPAASSSSSPPPSSSSSAAASPIAAAGTNLPLPPRHEQQHQHQHHHQQAAQHQHQQPRGHGRSLQQTQPRGGSNDQRRNRPANRTRSQRTSSGATPGMGSHLLSRKTRTVGGDAGGPAPEGDAFDFSEMHKRFDKETEQAKFASTGSASGSHESADVPVYDKSSSFFDNISCDVLDRTQGINTRLFGAAERELNKETFGAIGISRDFNRRGRGRGRGGGHRGAAQQGGQPQAYAHPAQSGHGSHHARGGGYRGGPRGGHHGGGAATGEGSHARNGQDRARRQRQPPGQAQQRQQRQQRQQHQQPPTYASALSSN